MVLQIVILIYSTVMTRNLIFSCNLKTSLCLKYHPTRNTVHSRGFFSFSFFFLTHPSPSIIIIIIIIIIINIFCQGDAEPYRRQLLEKIVSI